MSKAKFIVKLQRLAVSCAAAGVTMAAANGNANAQVTNLALQKPTMASSFQQSTTVPAGAVDGNPGTRWGSAFSDSEWLQVDLGSPQTVDTVTLVWEAA